MTKEDELKLAYEDLKRYAKTEEQLQTLKAVYQHALNQINRN